MFYYKLFVVLTIVQAILSIPLIKSSPNEPERCCVPKQFSAKIAVLTGVELPDGKSVKLYAHYNFSYDADRNMVAMKGVAYNVPDQEQTKLWIIENGNDGQIYTINMDTKQCDKSRMPVSPMRCIPDTATYIDSSIYGYGDKEIIGDTWLIKMNDTISYTTVSRGDCVPLTSDMFIREPAIVDGLTTTNFVPRIDDPSVFDIPSECQHL